MIYTIFDIANIAGGILLASNTLRNIEGLGEPVSKAAHWLMQFKNPIAWVAFVGGIFFLVAKPGFAIHDIVGILAGLILLEDNIKVIPAVGDTLAVWSEKTADFQSPIGIAALVVGILGLLNIHIFS